MPRFISVPNGACDACHTSDDGEAEAAEREQHDAEPQRDRGGARARLLAPLAILDRRERSAARGLAQRRELLEHRPRLGRAFEVEPHLLLLLLGERAVEVAGQELLGKRGRRARARSRPDPGHDPPPNRYPVASTSARSLRRAACRRDITVPSGTAEHLGDLAIAQVLIVAQDQDLAVRSIEPAEARPHQTLQLAALAALERPGLGVGRIVRLARRRRVAAPWRTASGRALAARLRAAAQDRSPDCARC